ncbi:MAG: DUF3857 domain-containing protein [Myxococcales bacterium]
MNIASRLLLVWLLLIAQAAFAQEAARKAPAAAWVQPMAVPRVTGATEGDTEDLLDDSQLLVEAGHHTSYRHVAYAVRSAAGVHNRSELTIARDSDEQVTWHFIRRHRGGEVVDLLPKLDIKVIQPESDLDNGLYDESKREVAFLEDVRVGDVIEYAFSRHTSDSVTGGAFAARYWLGRNEPIARFHVKVSWPKERTMQVREFGANVERTDDGIRYLKDNVQGYEAQSREPLWFEGMARMEISEFASWESVVKWALPNFTLASVDPSLVAQADALRKQARSLPGAGTPEELAGLAVRFVQDDVRYLGFEAGAQGVVPHPPAQVLAQRFGDCKDKTFLLVTLLQQLGIQAAPALVNTKWGRGIADSLPSPWSFDHAVVWLKLAGREVWVDATQSYQRGPVSSLPSLPYGKALVLRDGERVLRDVPVQIPKEPQVFVRERFWLENDASSLLEVHTVYSGSEANDIRARFAHEKKEDLQKGYLDFYGKNYGAIEVAFPLSIQDDQEKNQITVREQYRLTEVGAKGQYVAAAWTLFEHLALPEASRSESPFALAHPVRARHVLEIQDLAKSEFWEDSEDVYNPAFRYQYRAEQSGSELTVSHDFVSNADHVLPKDMAKYVKDAKKIRDWLETSYETASHKQTAQEKEESLYAALGLVLGSLGLFGGLAIRRHLKARREKQRRKLRVVYEPGETPETAISVAELSQVSRTLGRIKCCDAPLFPGELPDPSRVRYGGGELRVYKQACPRCGKGKARYFSLSDG